MTLELKNALTSQIIQVRLRFKLSPEMFEVVLVNMGIEDALGKKEESFSDDEQKEILKEFWNSCHEVWQDINDDTPKAYGAQMTLSDEFEKLENV